MEWEPLLSRKQAADILGLKTQTLASWAMTGKNLRFFKVGKLAKYKRSDLLAYLDKQAVGGEHLRN